MTFPLLSPDSAISSFDFEFRLLKIGAVDLSLVVKVGDPEIRCVGSREKKKRDASAFPLWAH